eukprot:1157778-Pelagomonas_calceolata.AAC.4
MNTTTSMPHAWMTVSCCLHEFVADFLGILATLGALVLQAGRTGLLLLHMPLLLMLLLGGLASLAAAVLPAAALAGYCCHKSLPNSALEGWPQLLLHTAATAAAAADSCDHSIPCKLTPHCREGWPELLLHTLLLLAESAQRLGLPTEAALHTLEASSLQPCLPSSAAPAPGSPPSLPPDAAPQGSSTSPAVGTVLGTGGTASGPALILNSAGGGGGGGGGGDAAAAAAAAAAASDASGTLQAATALLPVSLECCHAAAVALLSPACGPAAEQAEHAQQAGAGADSNVKGAGLLVGVNTCNAQKRHIFNVEYFDLEAREWLGGPELGVAREAPGAVSQLGGVQPSLLLQERGGGLAAAYAGSDGAGAGVLSPDVQLALEAHHQKLALEARHQKVVYWSCFCCTPTQVLWLKQKRDFAFARVCIVQGCLLGSIMVARRLGIQCGRREVHVACVRQYQYHYSRLEATLCILSSEPCVRQEALKEQVFVAILDATSVSEHPQSPRSY